MAENKKPNENHEKPECIMFRIRGIYFMSHFGRSSFVITVKQALCKSRDYQTPHKARGGLQFEEVVSNINLSTSIETQQPRLVGLT